jgi:hypothetical protein
MEEKSIEEMRERAYKAHRRIAKARADLNAAYYEPEVEVRIPRPGGKGDFVLECSCDIKGMRTGTVLEIEEEPVMITPWGAGVDACGKAVPRQNLWSQLLYGFGVPESRHPRPRVVYEPPLKPWEEPLEEEDE